MDPTWIPVAFALGFGARLIGLPPLLGFLVAGFVLAEMGVEGGAPLDFVADVGVTLLLFTIGLKLDVRVLLRPLAWGAATVHMLSIVVLFGLAVAGLAVLGLGLFAGMDATGSATLAFALSFSSTVFAVKIFEETGQSGSFFGRAAIGVLIMQDVFAVLFLVFSAGKVPSPWALALVGLIALRPIFFWAMERVGRGELLILLGALFGLGMGYSLFDALGVKGDLGALIAGMLLAGHPKAKAMAGSLMGFKDLFLVGFFLTIGIDGLPGVDVFLVGVLLSLAIPLKVVLWIAVFTAFRMKGRSAVLGALSLANYSEFGLIVGKVAVDTGMFGKEWLLVLAISVAISFVVAAILNTFSVPIEQRLRPLLRRFESTNLYEEERPIDTGHAEVVVFGMGGVGTAVYDELEARHPGTTLGIDRSSAAVAKHRAEGRNVALGDASDPGFWEGCVRSERVRTMLLAMDDHAASLFAARAVQDLHAGLTVAATARFVDQAEELREAGVADVYDFAREAGTAFADRVADDALEPSGAS